MSSIIIGLVLIGIISFLIYSLHSTDVGDPTVPYSKYKSYPVIGHLIPFLGSRVKFLIECRERYGECFRIRVFNKYFTMISSHTDWTNVIRNQSFQFEGTEFGIQIFDLSPVFLNQSEFDADSHRLLVKHLKNRDGLRPIVVEFVRRMRQLMTNEKVSIEKNGKTSEWISSGLLELSHRMLYSPSTLALMGDIDPSSFEKDFQLFDKKFHYFVAPFPPWIYSWFFSRELIARSRLSNSWLKNRDASGASEFHRDRLELFSANLHWMSEKDYGGLLTSFFWASLGNTIPAVFWSLFYIIRDSKALQTIKEEIDTHLPVVSLNSEDEKDLIEDWTPEQLDSCIYLESAVNEAIRLVAAPLMTRKCVRPTEFVLTDGRTINFKVGETLSWFGGVSHFDPKLFPEPTNFVFDRFVNKKIDTVPGYMPFGGGKSICPGRFFARFEIKTCVAMLLRYMECKLEDAETVPSQILPRIGIGIAPPSKDVTILYRYKS